MIDLLFNGNITAALFWLISVLIALTFHEVAHGYIAFKCGDDTARNFGRLTLNPLKHLDVFGFFAMLVAGFGWAKPVPVNYRNLKNPKRDIALVSLAGPVTNFILAFIGMLLWQVVYVIMYKIAGPAASEIMFKIFFYLRDFLGYFIMLNVGLGLFNLIPIPPLDGSKVLGSLLPQRLAYKFISLERYSGIFILGLFVLMRIPAFDFLFIPLDWLREAILNGFEWITSFIPKIFL